MATRPARTFFLVLALVLFGAGPHAATAQTHELAGSYILPDGEWDKVEATFTAIGSDSWNVEFRFDFQGRSETWKGDATGSLSDGAIEGWVELLDRGRSFVFRGEVSDGVLTATHAELENGGETPTGTMTLGPVDDESDKSAEPASED